MGHGMIVGIAAVGKNLEIGRGNAIPWKYPADLKFFKKITTGNAVVMGRRTWESIGGPLPDRLNIIMSKSWPSGQHVPYAEAKFKDVFVVSGIKPVIQMAMMMKSDLYVMGGTQIYEQFLPHIDEWVVTRVPESVEDADRFMPANFLDGFVIGDEMDLGDGLRVEIYKKSEEKTTEL